MSKFDSAPQPTIFTCAVCGRRYMNFSRYAQHIAIEYKAMQSKAYRRKFQKG